MRVHLLRRPAPIEERPLVAVDVPAAEPGPGEIRVEVAACTVCRTDVQLCEGDLAAVRLPVVPGHQVVGRVDAIGGGVTGWRIGDRVGVAWLGRTCGTCRFCRTDRENLCERAEFTGWHRHGGFAESLIVDANFALRVTDERADLDVAPLLCGGVIGYRSLLVSGIRPGGRLGLFGFGASARLAIQVARHWGCRVHVATRSETQRQRALDLGADSVGGYDDPPPRPLDAAVTFAPVGEVVISALRALDRGGVVAINAIHLDRIPAFGYQSLWWERQIRSVANFTRRDAVDFLGLAAEIPIRADVVPYPLSEANGALMDLKAGNVAGAATLIAGSAG
jgi:propanol-preferring alcohol dehydrogenase